jgi:sigma-B regulation protein RsbU (phosphoserine phosphatase)
MSDGLHPSVEEQLRNLEAVTDLTLARLDLETLLVSLLDRVREILQADTAAVLLLDEQGRQLVPRAASGIEEEVRAGARVPIGAGFAGRIAATRQPVVLDRVDATTVANPILWQRGIRVMVGVPLEVDDRLIGVLHVGRKTDRPFEEADARLLQITAERVAGATRAREVSAELAAAELLERSLLPARVADQPGLEMSARYLTPKDHVVGGDWYDVFTLPSGQLWLVTGDVSGHGLQAAVVMGRIRSALRAYALLGRPVAEVLELTDLKVQHFELDTLATVVAVTSFPPYDTLEVATAGHPSPLLAPAGAEARFLDLPIGPPLGAVAGARRASATVALALDAVLLLFTDGLVERRGEPLGESLEKLRRTVTPDHPDVVCATVLDHLLGPVSPDDDAAMVAVRRVEPEV